MASPLLSRFLKAGAHSSDGAFGRSYFRKVKDSLWDSSSLSGGGAQIDEEELRVFRGGKDRRFRG